MTNGMNSVGAPLRILIPALVLIGAVSTTGCGLKDDLYLPAEDVAAPADTAAAEENATGEDAQDSASADPTRAAE